MNKKYITSQKGFVLFVAIGVSAILLLVTVAMSNITLKQVLIAQASQESQKAFYAADNGIECVMFWEIQNPTNPGESAFGSVGQNISCGIQTFSVGGGNESEFEVLFDITDPANDPLSSCAIVTVNKSGGTVIESRGRNLCSGNSNRRVERGIRVKY
ncbi:MAG: hypothetical protein COV34_00190 [Candidatus Zambryskibacteria bacterium CG10_big_fil_rev_8_21_14_0_10_42_12]|uniref:Type 4 fimbrial biogenesis protein PilX N-terminal domain-containing protein n=1 Tax=Candidatus Zambryskibacteria bacterium CG10_big_fil_rev_8_21_14_0_10_42_12 TaxID=1975115 RepID=A0A2H0QXX4_9BACT|nr:MAG: hypothetical protein COV34_00190 [Candidatus Zambryskibacteria bacterium CG10_big_fil_rev_8_21_14_0_10_42_12]